MPLLFKQIRIGRQDKPFWIHKIRTMDENGNVYWWGKLLRKTGLDEVPQIINILKGEMTLVGPRPLTPWDHDTLRGFVIPCKPGMTGWWQIHGGRQPELFKYDTEYFRLRRAIGFTLDIYIAFKTIPLILLGRHR